MPSDHAVYLQRYIRSVAQDVLAPSGILLALYSFPWQPLANKSAEYLLAYTPWASTALVPQNEICYDFRVCMPKSQL
jgi:hypothetical protein